VVIIKPLGRRIYVTIVGQGFSLAIKNNANLKVCPTYNYAFYLPDLSGKKIGDGSIPYFII